MTIAREARRDSVLALLRHADGPLTVAQIATRIGVSIRTVHSDLVELRRRGHVIEGRTARGGGLVLKSEARPETATPAYPSRHSLRPEELHSTGFVGYTTQLNALKAGIARAAGGQGGVFLVMGEAGMGKSRLLAELESLARPGPYRVARGLASRHEGAPPYWPWVQVLRQLDTRGGDRASLLQAPSIPGIGALHGSHTARLESDEPAGYSAAGRFALMDSVANLIVDGSNKEPLLLLLDDLQWADEGTVGLWEFIASRLRGSGCMLVGASRPASDLAEQLIVDRLEVATRRSQGHVDTLSGLSATEQRELAMKLTGAAPPREALVRLRALSRGTPLFIQELLQAGSGLSKSGDDRWSFPLTASVRSIFADRLSGLDAPTVELLEDCAILGVQFRLDQLRAIKDRGNRSLDEMLQACAAHRLLASPAGDPGMFSFVHPIAREVVYDRIPAGRRTERHLQVFESLRRFLGDRADEQASLLAHHLQMSGGRASAASIVYYSARAAEQALAAFAPAEALTHFQRALDHSRTSAATPEVARLWHGLAVAQFEALNVSEYPVALKSLERAFDFYLALGDRKKAAEVAGRQVPSVTGWHGMARFTARALEIAEPGSIEYGHLSASHGLWAFLDERDERSAVTWLENALQASEKIGDRRLRLRTLCNLATVYRHTGRAGPDAAAARAAIPLAREVNDPWLESQARFVTATAFWWDGDVEGARTESIESIRLARRIGNTSRIVGALAAEVERSIAVADFERVRLVGGEALEFNDDVRVLHDLAHTEFLTGHPGRGLELLTRFDARNDEAGYVPTGARIAVVACILDPSLRISDLASPGSWEPRGETGHGALSRLSQVGVYAAHFANDRALSMACLERLKRPEDRHSWKWLMGSIGLVALVAGQRDRSEAEFEYATHFFKKSGMVLGLAWTLFERAHAMSEGRSSRGRALELADEAIALCVEHGITALAARLDSLRESLGSGVSFPAGLTRREVEVLGLLAIGKTNQEIADRLTISTNTVVRHIANVFHKTGSANRAQAASFAVSHGLTSS